MSAIEEAQPEGCWHDAASVDALRQATKLNLEIDGRVVLLVWNEGEPVAMDDVCIHKQRSLSEGALLNGRIVCPGHQWAFELSTGYCKAREKHQPIHPVRVEGDAVQVFLPSAPA